MSEQRGTFRNCAYREQYVKSCTWHIVQLPHVRYVSVTRYNTTSYLVLVRNYRYHYQTAVTAWAIPAGVISGQDVSAASLHA